MEPLNRRSKLFWIILVMSIITVAGVVAVIALAIAVSNALPTTTTNSSPTPPSSTPTLSTTTSIVSSSTVAMTTTTAPSTTYPCIKDVLMLIDVSNAIGGQQNFDSLLHFISSMLISNWTVSCTQVEACPCVYDAQTFIRLAAFDSANVTELQNSIMDAKSYYKSNTTETPSIEIGLELGETEQSFRKAVKKVTLLFTASSDPTDVNKALGYAADLKRNGNTLVVIGMGPSVNISVLSPLASGSNFAFSSSSFDALANNNALVDQINTAICLDAPGNNTNHPYQIRDDKKRVARSNIKYSDRRPHPCV